VWTWFVLFLTRNQQAACWGSGGGDCICGWQLGTPWLVSCQHVRLGAHMGCLASSHMHVGWRLVGQHRRSIARVQAPDWQQRNQSQASWSVTHAQEEARLQGRG
jgi:hypothetical protein